jgi:hypothetical protein
MFTVINNLPIKADADWEDIAGKFDAFSKDVKERFPASRSAVLTRINDTMVVFVGIYDDMETLEKVSSEIAAPWFAENLRKYMSAKNSRVVGKVIAGYA